MTNKGDSMNTIFLFIRKLPSIQVFHIFVCGNNYNHETSKLIKIMISVKFDTNRFCSNFVEIRMLKVFVWSPGPT